MEQNPPKENNPIPPPPDNRHLGCFEKIWETDYDEEMDMIMMDVLFCNGEIIKLNMKAHHIKELYLFMQKEHATKKYLQHVFQK